MDLPILPFHHPSIDRERNTFRLGNIDRFQVIPIATLRFDRGGMIVRNRGFVDRPPDGRNIDMNDFLRVGIENRSEVQGECVLAVIDVGSIIHESLL